MNPGPQALIDHDGGQAEAAVSETCDCHVSDGAMLIDMPMSTNERLARLPEQGDLDRVVAAEAEVLRAARAAAALQAAHDLGVATGWEDPDNDYRDSLARMFNARTEMMLAAKALRRADLAAANTDPEKED